MKKWNPEAEQLMIERFGKDTVIALATTEAKASIKYMYFMHSVKPACH